MKLTRLFGAFAAMALLMGADIALAAAPVYQNNTPLAARSGLDYYTLAVTGGTVQVFTSRDLNGNYLGSAATFVASGVSQAQSVTALATVGAGTLTGTAIVGGVIVRTGPVAVFTDTTDTASAIQAAWAGGGVNSSLVLNYRNTTAFTATLAGGSGVTFSGPLIVPANSSASFLVVWTGTNTVTITNLGNGSMPLPNAKTGTLNATTGSLPAGAITGARSVALISSNATPGAQLVRTAAQMLADIPGAQVGVTWNFRVCNSGAGTFTLTTDAGTTVTLSGTMTVAQNICRDFVAVNTSATAATITSVGSSTYD